MEWHRGRGGHGGLRQFLSSPTNSLPHYPCRSAHTSSPPSLSVLLRANDDGARRCQSFALFDPSDRQRFPDYPHTRPPPFSGCRPAEFWSFEEHLRADQYQNHMCSAYVKARKQLSVNEVPNILPIVLKRFQSGKYGKVNKCVTFPDMLDMVPFVTGAGDNPPLYFSYDVVVHLGTENASFSGHYI